MSKRIPRFTCSDLSKALQAATKVGLPVSRVELERDEKRDKIIVFTACATAGTSLQDDLDRELAEFEVKHSEG